MSILLYRNLLRCLICMVLVIEADSTATARTTTPTTTRPQQTLENRDTDNGSLFWFGVGIHDMTGPAAQWNLMGYARSGQTAAGIHQRLRARSFIVSADKSLGVNSTICFVSADIGMGSDLINLRVLRELDKRLPFHACRLENLSISGTHTHSSPGGFLQYALFQISSMGFSEEALSAYVEGITQSLIRAHKNLQFGSITALNGWLWKANINRSPSSYLLNPVKEREQYKDQGDTDKNMLLLRFQNTSHHDVAMLNWFAVHGTSMNGTNKLLSGDNRGYASYLMERHMNGNHTETGKGSYVAAFASSNLGDVSPNTGGPRCIDSGLPCDVGHSSCNGRNELCVASGPGKDMMESTEIIGRRQFEHALSLLNKKQGRLLEGSVRHRHSFINMANVSVRLDDGSVVSTCPSALGYSFAAGTTDGHGQFDFTQGTNTTNPFWKTISNFVSKPSAAQVKCQAPKPILLNTATVNQPYPWEATSIPISIFAVGSVLILNVPGEFTTMAGRRLRRAVNQVARQHGLQNAMVTIAGLANTYTHYITTFEEYQGQRYEAASTLFGPHTLDAYIQEFRRIADDLFTGRPSISTAAPPVDLTAKQMSLVPPVIVDTIPFGKRFGGVKKDAEEEYVAGADTVQVSFHSANPRNNPRLEGTFLTVDRQDHQNDAWTTVHVDGDWCTRYRWEENTIGVSYAQIEWEIPVEVTEGRYRICHYGTRKKLWASLLDWQSHSSSAPLMPPWLWRVLTRYSGLQTLGVMVDLTIDWTTWAFSWNAANRYLSQRLVDFQGCSKTFLVRGQEEPSSLPLEVERGQTPEENNQPRLVVKHLT